MSEVIQSREKFIDFKRDKCRLNNFFQNLGIEESYPSLAMILKITFMFMDKHGQLFVLKKLV